jgi:DNA-binding CsgD family transcriptional regulator
MSGVRWHEELTKAQIQVPVIFLTAYGSIAAAVRATKEGAVDFLTKPVNAQQLLDAVFAALAQDRMRREEERVRAAIRERFVLLTPREREVLFRVAAGRLNKQIAGELGVSEVMVKVHRRNVMRKLNVKTVADLVRISDYFYWSLSKETAKEILSSVCCINDRIKSWPVISPTLTCERLLLLHPAIAQIDPDASNTMALSYGASDRRCAGNVTSR